MKIFLYRNKIAFLVLLNLLVSIVTAAIPDADKEKFEKAVKAKEKYTKEFFDNIEGAVGIGVSSDDETDGNPGGNGNGVEPYIIAFVEEAGSGKPRATVDGVKVKRIVSGKFLALGGIRGTMRSEEMVVTSEVEVEEERRKLAPPEGKGKPGGGDGGDGGDVSCTPTINCRPAPLGASIGHPTITAGTLGARVVDIDNTNNVYILSNNHVLAASNNAVLEDDIVQPGTYDGGSLPGDDIANLSAFIPIKFDGTCNYVDAALAKADDPNFVGRSTIIENWIPQTQTLAVSPSMRVKKCGRTTGCTKGKVYAINVTVNVQYSVGAIATFCNQIVITPGSFSDGGDSGSLVVAEENLKPVGLLYAGSSRYTIINRINPVLETLGTQLGSTIRIDGQ